MSHPNAKQPAFTCAFILTMSCAGGRSDATGNLSDAAAVAIIDAGLRSPTSAAPSPNGETVAPGAIAVPPAPPPVAGEPATAGDSEPNDDVDRDDLDASLPEGNGAPIPSAVGTEDDLDAGMEPREAGASASSDSGALDGGANDGGTPTDAGPTNGGCPMEAPEDGDTCESRGQGGSIGLGDGGPQCAYETLGCSCVGDVRGTGIWSCSPVPGGG